MTEREIIDGCRRGDAIAQRELYERFSPLMYGVCLRYVREKSLAEDILQDGFITVFTKIGEFRSEGSFEGWCRRIFVNTALGYLRKKNALSDSENIDDLRWLEGGGADAVEKMSGDEVLEMIDRLPQGYRTILNLYAVEGYSHKEIGEMMGISENTSRSQYFRARGKLMEILSKESR
ncbi:MAG: sigma-70 family RNA polymerase sigma factor [Alistipes sp.]|nr:sigma-70 family RNA polymerase sigma factor [Alistipes sp.]